MPDYKNMKYEDMSDKERILSCKGEGPFRRDKDNGIKAEAPDLINSPPHYQHGGIETIDLIEAFLTPEEFRGYLKGTLYAYRDRAPYKGQTESDYEKAKVYWDWLKKRMGE